MFESYLTPRAEEFSREAALSLVLNTRLELLLAQYGKDYVDSDGPVVQDIPITNDWSLDMHAEPASIYSGTGNRQGEPLKDVVMLVFWLSQDELFEDYINYTVSHGGATQPIFVGRNGVYDAFNDHHLDSAELEALFMDVQTVIVPYLEGTRDTAEGSNV